MGRIIRERKLKIIVFPDKFYLWTDVKGHLHQSRLLDREPDYSNSHSSEVQVKNCHSRGDGNPFNNSCTSQSREMLYMIDARSILQPYFEKAKVTADSISSLNLELIVLGWLSEIIYSEKSTETLDKSLKWLVDSGLYAALAGGQVKHEGVA